MDDRLALYGTADDTRVLRDALTWYRYRAFKRLDPDFVPKPGKKDRNKEIMRLTDIVMPHLREGEELALVTTDAGRRLLRNALQAYAEHLQLDPGTIHCDGDLATDLANRIPNTALVA